MGKAAKIEAKGHPSRFRQPSENKDFFLKLADMLFIREKLTPQEVDRYGDYLWVGDELADRLAKKFHELGMQKAMRMLDEALAGRVASDAPEELKDLIQSVSTDPAWLDRRLLDDGAALYQRSGLMADYVLSCVSLMGGYRSSAANKPIAFTGQLDYMAPRRLAETAQFGFDVTRTGSLVPGAKGWKAAIKVRMMHAHVRLMLDRSPKWRHDDWGLPINQADLLATNTLFSVLLLSGLRVLGLQISDAESLGTMHMWRYIGYLMGIREELLPANEREGMRAIWLAGVTQPPADADSRLLGQALMKVPLERAESLPERMAAHLEVQMRSGLSRLVLGDKAGDDLGLPNTPLKYTPLLIAPAIFALETVRNLVPGLTQLAIRLGGNAQQSTIDKIMQKKPATFTPPAELKREAAYGRSAEAEHRALLEESLLRPKRRPLADVLAAIPPVGNDSDFARQDSGEARRVFD